MYNLFVVSHCYYTVLSAAMQVKSGLSLSVRQHLEESSKIVSNT